MFWQKEILTSRLGLSPHGSGFRQMAGVHTVSNITAGHNHGIRFLNEDWNESISNDQTFLLRWNSSINSNLSKDLGLFKVEYPANGAAVYSLYTNLTGTHTWPLIAASICPANTMSQNIWSRAPASGNLTGWATTYIRCGYL